MLVLVLVVLLVYIVVLDYSLSRLRVDHKWTTSTLEKDNEKIAV